LVEKTTLYLPQDLKAAIKRAAVARGVSEAEVIRQSIQEGLAERRPRPKGALFSGGRPTARDAEQLLRGFGDR
jgi:hypothetical protein